MARNTRNMYIEEGSAARRYEEAPRRYRREYQDPRREYQEPRRQQSQERRNVTYREAAIKAEASRGFDLRYTAILVLMLALVIVSCVVMLTVQGEVEAKESRIESLREQLQDIQADNAAYANKLDSMYSLEDIYTIATGELGMVYSQNGQIVYYDQENGDYVKQYNDVPKTVD